MGVHKIQLNFDSRGLLATRNEVILRIEEVWHQFLSEYPKKFTNQFQEYFLQSNLCVVAPQNISNTTMKRLFIINYFEVLLWRRGLDAILVEAVKYLFEASILMYEI